MVSLTQVVSIGIRIIGRSWVEGIDIIDLITTVLGKRTLNLAILSQMVNGITYFT